MPLRSAKFCMLLVLAGCATQVERTQQNARAAPSPVDTLGTILAMRPVPVETSGPARILSSLSSPSLSSPSLGSPSVGSPSLDNRSSGSPGSGAAIAFSDGHLYEFIVRTEGGTTIAIVQPQQSNLQPGIRVSILRAAETRINAIAAD